MKHLLFDNIINLFQGRLYAFFGIICFLLFCNLIFAQDAFFPLEDQKGCYEVKAAYDGGYYVVNTSYDHISDGTIIKLNHKGEEVWKIEIHPEDTFLITEIDELSNGDVIIAGETTQYWSPYIQKNHKSWDGVLARINTCGEVEWIKIVVRDPVVKLTDPIRALLVDSDDNIWVNHYINLGLDQDLKDTYADGKSGASLTISKFNADGEFLNRTEELLDNPNGIVWELKESSQDGVLSVGYASFLPYYNQVYSDTNDIVYDRALVMKIDEECEIQWHDVYNWENDEVFDPQTQSSHPFIKFSRASSILETPDSNYLVMGINILFDTALNNNTYNLIIYELDKYGELLRDTMYQHTHSVGYSFMKYLNDTTIALVTNPFPLDDIYGDNHLEVWKINTNTFEVEGRFIDTNKYYSASRIDITDEGKILIGSSKAMSVPIYSKTHVLVINPETMELDTIPSVDTNTYDYLCNGTFMPELINLPDDTTTYEPIGVYEYESGQIEIVYDWTYKNLKITSSLFQHARYIIANSKGQILLEGELPKQVTSLNVDHLQTGIYHIKIQTADNNTCDETFVIR